MHPEIAVVLGPGGPVGTAWLAGLAAGLRRAGVDLGAAGLIVGTSAGGQASLPEAMAASTAFPWTAPPITVGGRRYIDGALRAGANADLAAGARVLIVAEPAAHIFGPSPAPAGTVVRLAPDAAAIKAFGPDITAYDVWEPAYRAGLRQAADAAGAIRAVG